jgi:hypothetical protein
VKFAHFEAVASEMVKTVIRVGPFWKVDRRDGHVHLKHPVGSHSWRLYGSAVHLRLNQCIPGHQMELATTGLDLAING